MKRIIAWLVALSCLSAVMACFGFPAPLVLLFGWIAYPLVILSRLSVEPCALYVGAGALVLLLAVTHHLMHRLYRAASPAGSEPALPRRWRFRWTLAGVFLTLSALAAGIALVATIHEVTWLVTSNEPVVQTDYTSARRSQSANNLRQIGLGADSYHRIEHRFPPGGTFNQYGEAQHSWETLLLPHLENPSRPDLKLPWDHADNARHFQVRVATFLNPGLYRQQPFDEQGYALSHNIEHKIDMKIPWNHPANAGNFRCVVPEFINLDFRTQELFDAEGFGLSHYAANSRVLRANRAASREELFGETSNTILIGEVNHGFKPWGHPANWRDPATGINRSNGFGGAPGSEGCRFVMMDGSVRSVSQDIDPAVLEALSGPSP